MNDVVFSNMMKVFTMNHHAEWEVLRGAVQKIMEIDADRSGSQIVIAGGSPRKILAGKPLAPGDVDIFTSTREKFHEAVDTAKETGWKVLSEATNFKSDNYSYDVTTLEHEGYEFTLQIVTDGLSVSSTVFEFPMTSSKAVITRTGLEEGYVYASDPLATAHGIISEPQWNNGNVTITPEIVRFVEKYSKYDWMYFPFEYTKILDTTSKERNVFAHILKYGKRNGEPR